MLDLLKIHSVKVWIVSSSPCSFETVDVVDDGLEIEEDFIGISLMEDDQEANQNGCDEFHIDLLSTDNFNFTNKSTNKGLVSLSRKTHKNESMNDNMFKRIFEYLF